MVLVAEFHKLMGQGERTLENGLAVWNIWNFNKLVFLLFVDRYQVTLFHKYSYKGHFIDSDGFNTLNVSECYFCVLHIVAFFLGKLIMFFRIFIDIDDGERGSIVDNTYKGGTLLSFTQKKVFCDTSISIPVISVFKVLVIFFKFLNKNI